MPASMIRPALALALAGASIVAASAQTTAPPAPAPAAPADPTLLSATLNGAAEVPAADPDGAGSFKARLFLADGKFCYTLTSSAIGKPTMAHVHAGATGVSGPPVITLIPDAPKEVCLVSDKALLAKIATTPGDYYVNIHDAEFPGGAIRGQLVK